MLEINKIHNMDCLEGMRMLPDKSIDLVVSSPPYYNLREYSYWSSYESYIGDVRDWFIEMGRILADGGHICWNIQENIPEPLEGGGRWHYPLLPDTVRIGIDLGLLWERNVVWNKKNATQIMFGSYPYPPTPIFMGLVEYIIVFKKRGKLQFSREDKERCRVDKDRWFEIVRNVWDIAAEKASRVGHSAPYPVEIPKRFIEVMTVNKSVVLDPFMGSGTTGVACVETGRNYIGFELDEGYWKLANERVSGTYIQNDMFG